MATRIGFLSTAVEVAATMEIDAVVDARSEAPGCWPFEETHRCWRKEQPGMVNIFSCWFSWGEAGVVRIVMSEARVSPCSQLRGFTPKGA